MTLAVTHSTVATFADEPGVEINKGEWNDPHSLAGFGSAAEANVGDFDAAGAAAAAQAASQPVNSNLTSISAGTAPAALVLTNATGLPTAGLLNDAVTYAKIQNVSAASKLLGRGDSGSGDVEEVTLGTGLTMSGTTLNASASGTVLPSVPGGRLSLTTGLPVTTAEVTAAGTIYYGPFTHSTVCIYSGAVWVEFTLTEKSLSVTAVSGAMYSDFIYNNAGTLTLESVAWLNSTVTFTNATDVVNWTGHGLNNGDSIVFSTTGALPATTGFTAGVTYYLVNKAANTFQLAANVGGAAITFTDDGSGTNTAWVVGLGTASATTAATVRGTTTQDGVLVKAGDATRLFIGCHKASGTNTTEDSETKRYLWNAYNRVLRTLRKIETTDSWTSPNSTTWRQANSSTANQVEAVSGVSGYSFISVCVSVVANPAVANASPLVASIGEDSVIAFSANASTAYAANYSLTLANLPQMPAVISKFLPMGAHKYCWIEALQIGTTTGTFYGDAGLPALFQSGMYGDVEA